MTKGVDVDSLETLIEGNIESMILNIESGYIDPADLEICFKYREISILKKVGEAIKKATISINRSQNILYDLQNNIQNNIE